MRQDQPTVDDGGFWLAHDSSSTHWR
jgi:hypothetical protein